MSQTGMSSKVDGSTVSSRKQAPLPSLPAPTAPTTTLQVPKYKVPRAGLPDRLTHACLSKKDLRYMDQILKRVGTDPGPGHFPSEKADDVVHYTAPRWSYKPAKPGVERGDIPGKRHKNDAFYEVCTALDKVRPRPPVWSCPKGPGHRVAMVESCGCSPYAYTPVKGYVDAEWVGRAAACGAVQRLGSRCKNVSSMSDSKEVRVRKDPALNKPGPGPGHYTVNHAVVDHIQPIWSQSKTDCSKVRFGDVMARNKMWVPAPGQYNVTVMGIGQPSPLSN